MVKNRTFNSNKSKSSIFTRLLIFLKAYWLPLVIIVFGLPLIIRFVKDQIARSKAQNIKNDSFVNAAQNVVSNPNIQQQKIDKILSKFKFVSKTNRSSILADAKILPKHLGVYWMRTGSWYEIPLSFSALTENDAEIGKILRRQSYNYPILEQLYYGVFTESRNLTDDLQRWLDKDELEKTRAFWKSKGQKWF